MLKLFFFPTEVKEQYTCNSSNVIYALKCPCGKMYIGQTSRMTKIRLNEHRSAIRTYQEKIESDKKKEDDKKMKKKMEKVR